MSHGCQNSGGIWTIPINDALQILVSLEAVRHLDFMIVVGLALPPLPSPLLLSCPLSLSLLFSCSHSSLPFKAAYFSFALHNYLQFTASWNIAYSTVSLMDSAEMINKLWKLWEEINVWTEGYGICLLQFCHLSKSGERVTQVSHHG